MRECLTQERLREVLRYDPDTGLFVWLVSTSNRVAVGQIAGSRESYGYWVIGVDGTVYRAQRLAWLYMTGEWPPALVDHRNLDRKDNRWRNLRLATHSQNHANAGLIASNSSGHKGVSKNKRLGKWHACIMVDKRRFHLGFFSDIAAAAAAYERAAVKHFGEFARVS